MRCIPLFCCLIFFFYILWSCNTIHCIFIYIRYNTTHTSLYCTHTTPSLCLSCPLMFHYWCFYSSQVLIKYQIMQSKRAGEGHIHSHSHLHTKKKTATRLKCIHKYLTLKCFASLWYWTLINIQTVVQIASEENAYTWGLYTFFSIDHKSLITLKFLSLLVVSVALLSFVIRLF